MEMSKWTADEQYLYFKSQQNIEAAQERMEHTKTEFYEKGNLEGKIKGEISKIKSMIECQVSKQAVLSKVKLIKPDLLEAVFDYVNEHLDDNDSDICEELGLIGGVSD